MKPGISVSKTSNVSVLNQRLKQLQNRRVLVGIPAENGMGRNELNGKKPEINNASLLYIHTHGSDLQGIPARPVIEPAIEASGNKEAIVKELAGAAQAGLNGDQVEPGLARAGLVAQNASRNWFTDPRNNWAPNAPSTIKRKGSDRPLIDTGQLRNSITYVVKDDE